MEEDKRINDINKRDFKIYNTYGSYKCCLCGKKVYADDSYSNQGDRLICDLCFNTKFKNRTEARKWMNRENI